MALAIDQELLGFAATRSLEKKTHTNYVLKGPYFIRNAIKKKKKKKKTLILFKQNKELVIFNQTSAMPKATNNLTHRLRDLSNVKEARAINGKHVLV